jgi:3-deoxy-D-manno-octulosonic acid kinase
MTDDHISKLHCGTVLCAANRSADLEEAWFDRESWLREGADVHSSTGRAPVLIGKHGTETWVLRHYQRGGFVGRFVDDHYWWLGLERTRAFVEWRLLRRMQAWGLPSPEPIAACVRRSGLLYQADIIVRFLPDTRTLSAHLRTEGVGLEVWKRIGRMLGGFHAHGVRHPDLTAHNILIDGRGEVFLVDFDNAVVCPPGPWRERGIARLQRSLRKVAMETGTTFDERAWDALVTAYSSSRYGSPSSAGRRLNFL